MALATLPITLSELIPPEKQIDLLNFWNKVYSDAMDDCSDSSAAEAKAYSAAYGWITNHNKVEKMERIPLSMRFSKFVQFTKIDSTQRTVTGVFTSETPDKTGEICDYDSSKPYYQQWSNEFAKATNGQSLGNLREMHGLTAAGKITDILFDDSDKKISGTAKVVDDAAWKKCCEGVYTGFSHGGEYVGGLKKEKGSGGKEYKRYTAKPSEMSLVDNPANPDAHFEFVKADGTIELRKFHSANEEIDMTKTEVEELINNSVSSILQKGIVLEKKGDSYTAKPFTEQESSPTKVSGAEWLCPECKEQKGKCKCAVKNTTVTQLKKEEDPYGNVEYADPGHQSDGEKRYPIDTAEHIRAAHSYISVPKNADKYSPAQLSSIKSKVNAAWKDKIDEDGPPSAEKMARSVTIILAKTLKTHFKITSEQLDKVFGGLIKIESSRLEKSLSDAARAASIEARGAGVDPRMVDALGKQGWEYEGEGGDGHQFNHPGYMLGDESDHTISVDDDGNWEHDIMGNRMNNPAASGTGVKSLTDHLKTFHANNPPYDPDDPEKPFKRKTTKSSMRKGMNHISQLAQILLELAWLKWSTDQEQQAEGDEDSPLPKSLQDDIASLAQTLVDMSGEETKELITQLAEGESPDEAYSFSTLNPTPPQPFYCASLPDEETGLFKAMEPEYEGLFMPMSKRKLHGKGYEGYETTQPCSCQCANCRNNDCSSCDNPFCVYEECDDCPQQENAPQGFYLSSGDPLSGELGSDTPPIV